MPAPEHVEPLDGIGVLAAGDITLMAYSSHWNDFKIWEPPCSNPHGCMIQGIVNASMLTAAAAKADGGHSVTIGVQTDCVHDAPWSSFCGSNLTFVRRQLTLADRWFAQSQYAGVLASVPLAMECFGNFRRMLHAEPILVQQ